MALKDPEARRKYNREYRQKNLEARKRLGRSGHVRRKYGLSLDEYERIMEAPCCICGKESQALDHCHKTGKVRGPLCDPCNLGLGKFNDNPCLLLAAVEHLRGCA